MRIAMISDLYYPFPGGVSEAVHRLSVQLARLGHEMLIYTSDRCRNRRAPHHQVIEGVTIERIPPLIPSQVLYGHILNPFKLVSALRKTRPDIIHLHGTGHLENDLVALTTKDIPMVMTGHGGGMFARPGRPQYQYLGWELYSRLVQQRSIRRMAAVVACSPYEVPYWQGRGVKPQNIFVVPWGIPEDCFQHTDGFNFREEFGVGGFMILFVGSLVPGKGAQWLIRALPQVLREVPHAMAVFCGPALGYEKHLEMLARQLRLEDKVVFTGYLPRYKLLQAYSACDVFVLPSYFEGFGLAIAEAMASAKPVVACRVGAVPFLVEDGRSGFLVRPADSQALADKIITLVRDDSLRQRFGERGRALSQHYRWENVAHMYEQVYMRAFRPV